MIKKYSQYIKESFDTNYKVGDYTKSFDNSLQKGILNCFEIIRVDKIESKKYNVVQYYIEYIRTIDNTHWDSKKSAQISRGLIDQKYIERLATLKEIEEFETIKNMIKYNL